MKWDSIDHINDTEKVWISNGDHAMFERAGYGILRFDQNVGEIIFSEENTPKWYQNTTTYNEIRSKRWAGHDSYENFVYTYQYPHAAFANWFNMTTFSPDGSVAGHELSVSGIPVNATATPDYTFGDEDTTVVWLDTYLYDKALHDTGDEKFAEAVVQEMHNMTSEGSGSGSIEIWMNKTALEFRQGFISLENIPIMEIPRYHMLGRDALMEYNMTAGFSGERIIHLLGEFEEPYHETVNLFSNNRVNVSRVISGNLTTDLIRFNTTEYFGDVATVQVGGRTYEHDTICSEVCTVSAGDDVEIILTNKWGGTASAGVDAVVFPQNRTVDEIWDNTQWLVLVIGVFTVVSFIIIKSVMRIFKTRELQNS